MKLQSSAKNKIRRLKNTLSSFGKLHKNSNIRLINKNNFYKFSDLQQIQGLKFNC